MGNKLNGGSTNNNNNNGSDNTNNNNQKYLNRKTITASRNRQHCTNNRNSCLLSTACTFNTQPYITSPTYSDHSNNNDNHHLNELLKNYNDNNYNNYNNKYNNKNNNNRASIMTTISNNSSSSINPQTIEELIEQLKFQYNHSLHQSINCKSPTKISTPTTSTGTSTNNRNSINSINSINGNYYDNNNNEFIRDRQRLNNLYRKSLTVSAVRKSLKRNSAVLLDGLFTVNGNSNILQQLNQQQQYEEEEEREVKRVKELQQHNFEECANKLDITTPRMKRKKLKKRSLFK